MIICPGCSFENADDAVNCAQCAAPLLLDEEKLTRQLDPGYTIDGEILIDPQPKVFTDADELLLWLNHVEQVKYTMKKGDSLSLGRTKKRTGRIGTVLNLSIYGAENYGVSRNHAVINREGDGLFIVDLNSTNGTYLNLERIPPDKPCAIKDGDTIRLGLFEIKINFA